MDSATIESQIKGLLGLNLGGTPGGEEQSPASSSAPGSYPRQTNNRNNDKPVSKEGTPNRRDSKKSSSVETNSNSDILEEYPTIEALIKAEAIKENRNPDYAPPEILKQHLDKFQHISFLKKKPGNVRRQNWFCHLCEYHCDDLKRVEEHSQNSRHMRLVKLKLIEETLKLIPSPTKLHLEGLSTLLTNTAAELTLTQEDVSKREKIAEEVDALIKAELPECSVRLYGSSLSGFGMKSSDVNLDMVMTNKDFKAHIVLVKALEILQTSNVFRDVKDDFSCKHPSIMFKTDEGHNVKLSLHNNNAFLTSSLLKDYVDLDPRVKQLGINFLHWAKLTGFANEKNGTLPSHAFPILLIFFLQQLEKPVLPCIHENLIKDEENKAFNPDYDKLKDWKSENTDSVAQLWIQLFKFYALNPVHVVSIRSCTAKTHQDLGWKSKKLAIEDPFSTKRNLSSYILHTNIFSYLDVAFKTALLYFGTIQTCHGPVVTKMFTDENESAVKEGAPEWTLESWLAAKGTELTTRQLEFASNLVPKNMVSFSFTSTHLLDGCVMDDFCSVCITEGHTADVCPCENLPKVKALSVPSKQYLALLDHMFYNIKMRLVPTDEELRKRDLIMKDLNGFISRHFGYSELTLFGSCANGFGTQRSDLDISLTFSDKESADEIDCIKIIGELGHKISRMWGVKNVQSITSAKVPIVKLWYEQLNVEADISLYNILARVNTDMIRLYSELDPRFKTLGYIVKHFAKECDIGDASKQTLSSYAYMLMMIYFLQQTSPAVLPVLQEMYEGDKPENMVEGWNAWYEKDKSKINWVSSNKLSVGELWIKFLTFYAGDWDDEKYVVCIRQHKPLTKFEKMWNSKCIAIEDPFDLSHNLGSGVRRRMYLYIKKTFILAANLFGNPKKNALKRDNPEEAFFNRNLLTDGPKPVDRGCRACGKIGHIVKECPQRNKSYDKNQGRACRLCKEMGHLFKNCPERKDKPRSQSERDESGNWRERNQSTRSDARERTQSTRSDVSQVQSQEGDNEYYEDDGGSGQGTPFSTPGQHSKQGTPSTPGQHNRYPKPRNNSSSEGGHYRPRQISIGEERMNRTPPRHMDPRNQNINNGQHQRVFSGPPPPHGGTSRLPPPPPIAGLPPTQVPPPAAVFPGGRDPTYLPPPQPPHRGAQEAQPPQNENKLMQLLAQLQQGGGGGAGNNIGHQPHQVGPPQARQQPQGGQQQPQGGQHHPQGGQQQHITGFQHMMQSAGQQQQHMPAPMQQRPPGPQQAAGKPDPSQFPAALHHLLGGMGQNINNPRMEKAPARITPEKANTFDMTALAAKTGVSVGKKLPTAAINAEDLEKSLLGEDARDDRDITPVPHPSQQFGAPFGVAPGGPHGGPHGGQHVGQHVGQHGGQHDSAPGTSKPPPGFDRNNSSPVFGNPFMDMNQINMLQQLQQQQAAAVNPMMFPFLQALGVGFPMDPRLQQLAAAPGNIPQGMQQPMFGQMPHMFGPIIMGGPGGLGQHGQGMRPGGGLPAHQPFSNPAHEGGKEQGHGQGHGGGQFSGDQQHNNQVRGSPENILPPARMDNNSPDGSIQTAPSPLPSANSPMQAATPPPVMLGWSPNPMFQMPLLPGGSFSGPPPGMATPPRPFPSFNTGFSPFHAHPSGFQSSVLFPGDIQHPLAAGAGLGVHTDEQPNNLLDEGLPISPPIDIRDFDFDSMN